MKTKGIITSSYYLATLLLSAGFGRATVHEVSNNNDSGGGSFRQAILDANADSDAARSITFALPAGQLQIQPLSPLPAITQPVVIDGWSQPGFLDKPLVQLDGTFAGDFANGLHIQTCECTVQGLIITGFHLSGIYIESPWGAPHTSNKILGNYIGVWPDGVTAAGNGVLTLPLNPDPAGILLVNTDAASIGDGTTKGRNVISGNKWGIRIYGGGVYNGVYGGGSFNVIEGNYIGTDASGTVAVPNRGGLRPPEWDTTYMALVTAAGIFLQSAPTNTIRGNLLSGNWTDVSGQQVGAGIHQMAYGLLAGGCDGMIVEDNRVGTDATGKLPLGNQHGMWLQGGVGSVMRGNLVSANTNFGMRASGSAMLVENNRIGTDADGTAALGNGDTGLMMDGASACVVRRNVISCNRWYGVSAMGEGHVFQSNLIGPDKTGSVSFEGPNTAVWRKTSAWQSGIRITSSEERILPSEIFCLATPSTSRSVVVGTACMATTSARTSREPTP